MMNAFHEENRYCQRKWTDTVDTSHETCRVMDLVIIKIYVVLILWSLKSHSVNAYLRLC